MWWLNDSCKKKYLAHCCLSDTLDMKIESPYSYSPVKIIYWFAICFGIKTKIQFFLQVPQVCYSHCNLTSYMSENVGPLSLPWRDLFPLILGPFPMLFSLTALFTWLTPPSQCSCFKRVITSWGRPLPSHSLLAL